MTGTRTRTWKQLRPSPGPGRREFLAGGVGTAALVALGACGSNTDASRGSERSGGSNGAARSARRTVRHKYGSTVVPDSVSRVVALGYTDLEPLLGLGVPPVGIVSFFGSGLDGSWPWETPLWNGTSPKIIGERDDFEFEKIAALQPDLIIGMYSGMTSGDYQKLAKIAPTVAQPTGYADFTAPWPVMTRLAGAALNKSEAADRLVTGVEAKFAAARRAHPEWKGRTVAVVEPAKADTWAVFGAGDPKLAFFKGLGYTVAPSVASFNSGGDVKMLSTERLDVVDADQLVALIDTGDQTEKQIQANPLFQSLDVSQGRTAFVPFSGNPPIGAALSYNSVISIPYGITAMTAALKAQ